MKIRTTPLRSLPPAERQQWVRLTDSTPALANPFLHPAFAESADEALSPVHVAVARDDQDQLIGLLPYSLAGDCATPVAEGLNEQQAVITSDASAFSGNALLRAMGRGSVRWDHLVAEHAAQLNVWTSRIGGSPQADLTRGFDAYADARRTAGSSTIRQTLRKERKLIREHGSLHYSWHDDTDEVFQLLVQWKRRQHERTGVDDLFAKTKVVRFLKRIRDCKEAGFQARMSVLRVAGRPIAVHLGLFSATVGHVWYPAYDRTMGSYSPGLILLLKVMRSMVAEGIGTLDFGPGPQRYKQSLKTHDAPITIGVMDQSPLVSLCRKSLHRAKQLIKNYPLSSLRKIAFSTWKPADHSASSKEAAARA